MAVSRKTSKISRISKAKRKTVKVVLKTKPKSVSTPLSLNSILVFILFGFFFGFFLSKSRATDYDSIQDMFRMKDFQLYGVIGTAILVVAAGLFLTHRFKKPTLSGKSLDWEPLKFEPARLIGALLFGAGWALAGSCPGTVITQLGEGKIYAVFTIAGIGAGVWAFQKWQPKDSNHSTC
jgi:uncharacterized membrane protein YedE/YeeE